MSVDHWLAKCLIPIDPFVGSRTRSSDSLGLLAGLTMLSRVAWVSIERIGLEMDGQGLVVEQGYEADTLAQQSTMLIRKPDDVAIPLKRGSGGAELTSPRLLGVSCAKKSNIGLGRIVTPSQLQFV